MSSAAGVSTIRADSKFGRGSSPFLTVRLLRVIADFTETHGWWFFAAICLGCGWGRIDNLVVRHLDHDELFSFLLAQAFNIGSLLKLTRTIDLHPPLSYLLVRSSFAIFGVSAWSCRLPFFVAFLATSALLYSFVNRLLSPIYGLIAILILWSSPYARLATEARPYAMVLCFSAVLLVNWHEIVKEDGQSANPWALAMVMAGGFGLLLSHVLGVLAYGAFLAAEIICLWKRQKPNWQLWVTLLIPLIAVVSYLPLIRNRSDILFSEYSQASPRRLAICYWEHLRYLVTPLILIVLIAAVWPYISKRRHTAPPRDSRLADVPLQSLLLLLFLVPLEIEVLFVLIAAVWPYISKRRHTAPPRDSRLADVPLQSLLLLLFLVPLEIEVLFARTGTPFYERYGVVALIPCAIFPALVLGYRTHCSRLAGGSVAVLLAILLILNTSGQAWLIEHLSSAARPQVAARLLYLVALPPVAPPPLKLPTVPSYLESALNSATNVRYLDAVDPSIPLVAGSGPTFLELDNYQDAALRRRLYLLTNHEAASSIVHNTVFDHYEIVKAAFPIGGQVEPYCAFLP